MLKELHKSHIGIVCMKMIASNRVWWQKIDSEMVESCFSCQETKNTPAVAYVMCLVTALLGCSIYSVTLCLVKIEEKTL